MFIIKLFKNELKYDFSILQELLILSNKFSIDILQKKCENVNYKDQQK